MYAYVKKKKAAAAVAAAAGFFPAVTGEEEEVYKGANSPKIPKKKAKFPKKRPNS